MKKIVLLISIILFSINIYAICPGGFSEVIVRIVPDSYDYEVSWSITDIQGNIIASGDTAESDTICVDSGSCHLFTIYDSFGDGILSPGGYWIYLNGTQIGSGASFGYNAQHTFNCNPGSFCTVPDTISPGLHVAQYDNTWYIYTPVTSGTYSFNTCSLNTCNTKIWVYTTCPPLPYNEGVQGTYAYNDDFNCGSLAVLNVVLLAGTTYLIRIGDNLDSCASTVTFDFSYIGPIQGCTDITACNYNPLAVIDDSSCMYFPNPACAGPDLEIDSLIFIQSLVVQTHTANNCDVAEGCVTGYGTRHVISFTSRINNLGTLDFYIGNSSTQPGMFNSNNCHGHAHYEGYGDYRLFDSNGNLVPAGHKNGYCVIDLCGFGQYTCGNMGITAGCYDAYGVGTQCQWIDITDVPTGDYRIAVIINSKHLPDAMGHYETNYVNNALQVCMHITHNTSGPPTYTILPSCSPYVDCDGVPGGNAELDCNGICNGPSVYGDIFPNAVLDSQDVYTYMDAIQSLLPATNCNDLNRDSSLNVYDAALVNWCRRGNPLHPGGSVHNHCNFPRNILNPNDLTGLAITSVNYGLNYVDVEIINPVANVAAYQFKMSGITINNVVSLASPVDFPVDVRFIPGTNEVIAISLEDSTLQRSNIPQALVRIYFSAITDTLICINSITDIINHNAERTVANVYGSCFSSVITSTADVNKKVDIILVPNPATDKTFIHLPEGNININEIAIFDISGKRYSVSSQSIKGSWYELDLQSLPAGLYIINLRNDNYYGIKRFVKL